VPIATIVEVAFATEPLDPDPEWTDITRWVRVDDLIRIQRGAADELAEIPAGMLTLNLDNSDGRFTPGLASSPYHPNVLKHRRIRVRQVHVHTNWITNATFEVNTADWFLFGSNLPSRTVSATHAHSGTNGCRITWATGGTANGMQTTVLGLQVGETYTASAWVWVSVGVPAVRLGIAGGTTGSPSTGTGAWERISHTWVATDTSHQVQITPDAATTSGQQVWIDDVMVELGTTPGTFDSTAPLVSPRYNGFVNRWPVGWPGGGRVAHTPITCTDVFKQLARTPLRSLLEEEVLFDEPLAYYPLAEPAGSTSAGDLSGTVGGPLTLATAGAGGDLVFAAATGPAATGLSAPVFTPLSSTSGQYLSADVGTDFEAESSSLVIHVSAWFSTTTSGRSLLALRSELSEYSLDMRLQTGTGRLQILFGHRDSSGGPTTTTVTWTTADLSDGDLHHVTYSESTGTVYIDGVSQGVQSRPFMFLLRRLSVGSAFGANQWAGSVSHVSVHVGGHSATRVTAQYNAGSAGFAGETADDRIARIAGYAGVDVLTEGTVFDPIASQGSGNKTALAMAQEVAASESGRLFADREDGLVYQARDLRYGSTSALTLDAADCEQPVYADDDQFLVNRIDASRPNGATVRVEDVASQAKYFVYAKPPLLLLKTSDAAVVDAAQWIVNRYSDPQPRIQSIEVEGATLGTTTYRALLDLDISDVFTLTGLPSQAPASSALLVAEGYQEIIGPEHHTWTFTTSPAVVDQVWQLDSATHSQLDETTRLAY
jgi:hypothetical protein